MSNQEYHHALSELGTLDSLIDRISPSSVITRKSLERRKRKVQKELSGYGGLSSRAASAPPDFLWGTCVRWAWDSSALRSRCDGGVREGGRLCWRKSVFAIAKAGSDSQSRRLSVAYH